MICFALSEEQKMMKETASKLVQENIRDNAHTMDEKGEIPGEFIDRFHQLGTTASAIPEEFGGYGMGSSPIMNAIILEELACGDMGYAINATLPLLFASPIIDMGTDAQKKKYLTLVSESGVSAGTCAFCEPHFMFDPAALKTTAVKKNNSYVLNGKKCFIPIAKNASHILAAASFEGKNELFFIENGTPGMTIGEREKNIGLNTLETHSLTLENCEVPLENRLGGDNGCDYSRFLQKTRTAMSAIATGIARASFEYARDYSKERTQFGELIASRQSVAFMIAEMAYEVDAMRLLTWKAASALEAGKDAQRESYLAKLYAGEMAMKLTDYGVQILGGHGYVRDHPVERYYRNGRGIAILEGMATV